jgi:predicted lipoprotein
MTDTAISSSSSKSDLSRWIAAAAIVLVVGAMAYDTKIVRIGSQHDVREKTFAPEAFGSDMFPKIQAAVETKAVDAITLAAALGADKKAATDKFGVATATGAIFAVKFEGVAGERKGNMNTFAVTGLPPEITVRVQTGPALNGTDLRDATGTIKFGQFKNQIEYQDAGSAINNEVKKTVLASIDPEALTGKMVNVIGVFRAINPKNWIVTPVRFTVK